MFDRMVVQEALKRTWNLDNNPGLTPDSPADDQSSVTSLLIFDIFGGEILKTHKKKGWHFYNRINGERIDFTRSERGKSSKDNRFEDLPSTPDETHNYFVQEDYPTLFTRFIRAFEEAVGLDKYRHGLTA
jgi:hypothetical protein